MTLCRHLGVRAPIRISVKAAIRRPPTLGKRASWNAVVDEGAKVAGAGTDDHGMIMNVRDAEPGEETIRTMMSTLTETTRHIAPVRVTATLRKWLTC